MPTIVGVKLRFSSKVLSFDPAGTSPNVGDVVIVETERGSEIGQVAESAHDVQKSELVAPLKPVLRVADEDDIAQAEHFCELETEAMPIFRDLVKKHGLDMKPVRVEYLFDGSKIVFYFSAEERVDFRELVRELAARFKARIDMRQVGVRDEARMVGGIGHCGQPLCCVRFPGDFQPVSIRMAKEQDLPLNPLKISGLCGRLMCCLRYEYDAYKDYKSRAPKRRAIIETPLGLAKVEDLNTPRETVTMRLEDGQRLTVPLCSMECGKDGARPCSISEEALIDVGAVLPTPPTPPPTESESTASEQQRKRRRRKSGGSGSGSGSGSSSSSGGGSKEAKPGSDEKKQASRRSGQKRSGNKASSNKAAGGTSAPKASEGDKQAGTSGSGTSSSNRRRRRRRPSQDGGSGTSTTE